jgi:solute carrier family 35 protein
MAAASSTLALSCGAYMLSSAGMSVFNKLAVAALPLPITLVVVQMLFTVLTLAVRPSAVKVGSRRDALRWGLTVPLLFAAMLVSSMFAMEHNTLGTVVVFRNVAPLFTLLIERMFRVPMKVTRDTVLSLVAIVLGVVLYHYHSIGFSRIGLVAICLNMSFAVLERLMQRHLMAQDPVDLSKPAMMLLNNACGLLPCSLLLLAYGEPAHWADAWASLTPAGCALIVLSCLNGLAISYAGLRVQQLVTATTFMVLTNLNKFIVIFFGVAVLHDPLTLLSGAGMLVAMGGGLWYGRARSRATEFAPPADAKARKDGGDEEEGEREMLVVRDGRCSSAHGCGSAPGSGAGSPELENGRMARRL